jgi:hypothetical protein
VTAPLEDPRAVILQFVRGERPWTDLATAGISVRWDGDRCEIENPRGVVAVAGVPDVARGLLALAGDPGRLRTWAFLVQAGSSFLDLDVDDHPTGEALLGAVWGASFGDPIDAEALRLAEQAVTGIGVAHENSPRR